MVHRKSFFVTMIGILIMKSLPRITNSFLITIRQQPLSFCGRHVCGVTGSRIILSYHHHHHHHHHRTWNPNIASKRRWLSQQQRQSSNHADTTTTTTTSIGLTTNESTTTTDVYDFIPSLEQLRNDPFMKQVRYAEFIISLFEEDNGRETSVLMDRLRAQLSHPDGIRGFMVTYLTTITNKPSNNDDDDQDIPFSLIKIIIEQIDPIHDQNELLSLMCMNVIMPTAMITMQPTEEMVQQSTQTAKRAIQLVKAILQNCKNNEIRQAIMNRCHDILSVAVQDDTYEVATDNKAEEGSQGQFIFWSQFFKKWGYQSQQQSDIANAIRSILQE
jgi:hypothetical protein